jgi:hypothetical protein
MVKKKKDNPLAGLTRFNVDPNPVTSAQLYSERQLIDDMDREYLRGGKTEEDWDPFYKQSFERAKESLEGIRSGKRSVLDNEQSPYSKTGLNDILEKASVNPRPGGDSPERWLPQNFNFSYDYGGVVDDYNNEAKKVGKGIYDSHSWDSGKYQNKGGKSGKKPQTRKDLEAAEPWRKTEDNPNIQESPEYNEWVKRKYDQETKGTALPSVSDIFTPGYKPREGFKLSQSVADMGSESGSKKPYSTAIPHVSQEQMAKEALAYIKTVSPDDTKGIAETEATLSRIQNQKTSNSGKSKDSDTKSKEASQKHYEEFWEKQKTEDPEAYAAHQKSLGKTGKVEEPALPQASEKPVAKKKKNEPEYIPSKSEKDFSAGRMPGITGTAEEAEAALARSRKASTAKVTGKAKEKLQGEIKSHPMYRGTRQLSDEEVAANESTGSIRASESVAATAKTPKSKGKGKKKDMVPHPDIPGAMTDANAEPIDEKPYIDDPAETLAANAKTPKMETVPRSDSSGNTVDVSRFAGQPKKEDVTPASESVAATAAPDKNKPGYYREKYGELLDSMTPEEKAMSEAGMAAVRDKEEAALDADEAERAGKSTPSSMPAPTGTGVASPTPTWGAPTGTGVSSPTATPASPTATPASPTATPASPTATPASPTATPPVGSGGPRSAPPATPRVKGPGLGSRLGGFFGGHGGRGGGRAPSTSGGTSTPSTSSANTTNITYGAPTFGDQTNLGRNDFGGGSGGSGGSGSINMSANSNQANQVQGQNVRIGGSYGGTVGGPVVASTSGRATSNNPRATVLSTGGPASQTQGHPRAQNAKRGGRPTSNNQTPTAPKSKNPRQQKP